MTTGLSFNRAKNQFAQHKFTVQKASISILNSNTPKTQNIVPSLPLNKLNKFQNDHPQNQEQNSQSLQSSFMNFNNLKEDDSM